MRLRYLGDVDMPLRHRVFAPGDVTSFDMDDRADAALAAKCAALPVFAADDVAEPPKRRGRPPKVKANAENAG
jgi:hypothetical protein